MAYLVVENFVGGLDTRRHILTSKPGSVVELRNAHITRGGEIEKRKVFELYKTLPSGTFGLNVCSNKLYTFGSQDLSVPSPVVYQRLQHPDIIFPMTKLVSMTSYSGKPFVIAEFSDNSRYAFYDGTIVSDWVTGVVRASHTTFPEFLHPLAATIGEGFTASSFGTGLTITGPVGGEFSVSVVASGGLIAGAPVTSVTAVKEIPEVLSKCSFIVNNGTEGSASHERWLGGLYLSNLPYITGIYIDGVEILNLSAPVTWNSVPQHGPAEYDKGPRLAWTLASLINANTANSGYSAEYVYFEQSGQDLGQLKIKGDPLEADLENGKVVQVEFLADPTTALAMNPTYNLVDSSTVAASPYGNPANGYYVGTFGTLSGGVINGVTSVKIDGVEVLGSRALWRGSNSATAQAIADTINGYTSGVEYTASAVDGGKVLIKALPSTGSSPNGKNLSVSSAGSIVIVGVSDMAGGVNSIGGVSQQTTIPYSGVLTPGGNTTITVTETENPVYPHYFGATRMAGLTPRFCLTHRSKVHVLADTFMLSSGLDNPTKWRISDLGTSFIDLSNNVNGSEDLVSAAPYQGKLAIFTRDACQVWSIDVDAAQNAQGQIIQNSGCTAPHSVLNWGEVDVFYLSDSGIRSLRARDASNQAVVNDIGTPVDTEIVSELRSHTEEEIFNSHSVVEPKDGRLMVTIGEKLYVLSQFPASGILAWSTYEPGFTITAMCVMSGRLYVRSSDNKVYLYGGSDNNTYDDCTVTVTLPYLDGGKAANQKKLNGIDITSDGTWEFYAGTDTYRPEVRDLMATITDTSLQLGRIQAYGLGTHIGVKLVSLGSGYHRVANIVVHYELNEAD